MLGNGEWIPKLYPPNAEEGFPSWVPRWDKTLPSRLTLQLLRSRRPAPWNASWELAVQTREVTDPKIISLKGALIDKIAFIERTKTREDIGKIVINVSTNRSLIKKYGGENSLRKELARSMTSGYISNEEDIATASIISFPPIWPMEWDGEHLDAFLDPSVGHGSFAGDIHRGRSFFTTSNDLMGHTSQYSKAGDSVCLLYEGQTFFSLRPAEDSTETCHLIGEVYIHGLMYGEALEMLKTGESEEQWFDLV